MQADWDKEPGHEEDIGQEKGQKSPRVECAYGEWCYSDPVESCEVEESLGSVYDDNHHKTLLGSQSF